MYSRGLNATERTTAEWIATAVAMPEADVNARVGALLDLLIPSTFWNSANTRAANQAEYVRRLKVGYSTWPAVVQYVFDNSPYKGQGAPLLAQANDLWDGAHGGFSTTTMLLGLGVIALLIARGK